MKRTATIFSIICAGLSVHGCKSPNSAAPTPQTPTIVDTSGRQVHLPVHADRLISLAPASTEILFELGLGGKIVGIDRYSNYPKETAKITQLGSNLEPSFEKIAALKPDAVFVSSTANDKGVFAALEALHVPVYASQVDSLPALYTDIERIAQFVGSPGRGRALRERIETRLQQIRTETSDLKPTSALVVVWPEPLIVVGAGKFVGDLLSVVGARNIAGESKVAFPQYSIERVLVQKPDVILIGSHADGPAKQNIFAQHPEIPAVKQHRVYTIDGDLAFRPGPRIVQAAEKLVELLHPEMKDD